MDDNEWSVEGVLDDWMSDISNFAWQLIGDLVDVGADLLEQVPVPEFLGPMTGYMGSVPESVLYFATPFEIAYGLTVISAALASRLLLSLLPLVGGAFR